MDLSSINKLKKSDNNAQVAFQGRKSVKDKKGAPRECFFLPHINLKKGETLGIEFVRLEKQKDKSYKLDKNATVMRYPALTDEFKDFEKGLRTSVEVDVSALKNTGEYGYRFAVYNDKGERLRTFSDDVGVQINHKDGPFTIVSTRQGFPATEGAMEHIFTDSYNAKNAPKNFERSHFNKAGGNIQGIIEKINNGNELEPYRYIMTTPLIGGGSVSPHMYHPANHFKVSDGTGTKKDFMDLQVACFNKGKGYVLDGAFTSSGYEGVQLKHALKHKDSPFKYWFKNPENDGYALGVLSDDEETDKYTGIRIVNPKHAPGYDYNPNMPTYIQFYDTRLVSKEQLEDKGKIIKEYAKSNTDDPYEETTWDDSILSNTFEVDPDSPLYSTRDTGTLEQWNNDGILPSILSPKNLPYSFNRKAKVGGTTGWDGNIDLVKLNLSNHSNDPKVIEGSKQAKNQMYNVARYWTEEARNAILMNIAERTHYIEGEPLAKYLDNIEKTYNLERGSLETLRKNIEKEDKRDEFPSAKVPDAYDYKIAHEKKDGTTLINEAILNFPLESLNFSPELLGILSTPYITPRPNLKCNSYDSRLEIFNKIKDSKDEYYSPNMKEVYGEILPSMVREILHNIQAKGEGKTDLYNANGNDIGELTEYGKYFIKVAMDDIMQFCISYALFGEDGLPAKNGNSLDFELADNDTDGEGKHLNLKRLEIYESNSKNEADAIAKKLKTGLKDLRKNEIYIDFQNYLKKKYTTLTLDDYKLADAIIDKTGAGLNWRFDAAKDVGDFEETKGKRISAEDVWDNVIDFWKPFVKNVRDVNDSAYIVAEVTSLWDYANSNWGKYGNPDKAEKMFYEEVGATTGSNYSTFFGLYPHLFGQNIEDGSVKDFRSMYNFLNQVREFVNPPEEKGHSSSEFILGSHVFLDNHDKPRAAHLQALDSALFWGDFKNDADKERAEEILNTPYNDNMSSKAVAVAEKYLEYFEARACELHLDESDREIIKDSIIHLANGYSFKDVNDNTSDFKRAEAFGNKPFEITIPHVLKIAEKKGLKLDEQTKEALTNGVFEDMVAPYESKMTAIYDLMTATVGIPTIFAGDEFAQTGSETKSKNWALGCRNLTMHDWLKDPKKFHVRSFYNRLHQTALLAKTSKEMSALANGTPIVIGAKQNVQSVFDIATKDEVINGLIKLIDNDIQYNKSDPFKDTIQACKFLNCIQEKGSNVTKDEIVEELESMDKDELFDKLRKTLDKCNDGFKDWICNGLISGCMSKKPSIGTETGAVVKYNNKGSIVVSMMTNAFIPDKPDVNILKPEVDDAPDVSSVKLINPANKEPIAKEGAIFIRKAYDPKEWKFVNAGRYVYTKEGTLKPMDKNASDKLDSTVTFFCKAGEDVYRTM